MSGAPEERLRELGVDLPTPPRPAGIYRPVVAVGDLLFTSGQVAIAEGSLVAAGRVGVEVDLDTGRACARQCAINLMAQLKAALDDLGKVRQFVKVTVFVASAPSFTEQHLVANGASELLSEVFGDAGRHARSAVGMASLPLGSPVEVEAIVQVR